MSETEIRSMAESLSILQNRSHVNAASSPSPKVVSKIDLSNQRQEERQVTCSAHDTCRLCGRDRPENSDDPLCSSCRLRRKRAQKTRRMRATNEFRCSECYKALPDGGKYLLRTCPSCRARTEASRQRRISQNRCVACNEPRSENSKQQCVECSRIRSKRQRQLHHHRIEHNLCYRCGKPADPGMKSCEVCRFQQNEYRARSNARKRLNKSLE
ncbi:hypothetical protein F5Y15DRAFT_31796 [Xylariaceae sp. FL0016]|nr:hypothetical protein F5Y15DRAFT_31796 [Xylariaceae sp. FL0016]